MFPSTVPGLRNQRRCVHMYPTPSRPADAPPRALTVACAAAGWPPGGRKPPAKTSGCSCYRWPPPRTRRARLPLSAANSDLPPSAGPSCPPAGRGRRAQGVLPDPGRADLPDRIRASVHPASFCIRSCSNELNTPLRKSVTSGLGLLTLWSRGPFQSSLTAALGDLFPHVSPM